MREHGVGKTVFEEGVEFAVVLGEIDRPVVAQLLGAQHQHTVVAQLVVLDDRQCRVGFTQAHAIGQDAAVVLVDLVDSAFDAVFLEVEQGLPDVGVDDGGLVEQCGVGFLPGQKALEDVIERFEIDELRRVIDVKLLQVAQNISLDVGNQFFIAPDFIEPLFEVCPVAVAIDNEVQFDVGLVGQAEAAPGEV